MDMASSYGLDVLYDRLQVATDRHFLKDITTTAYSSGQFHVHVCEVESLKANLRQLGRLVISAPQQPKELWSDATLTCAGFSWNVHQLFVCRDCEFLARAFSGNFKEANEARLDLTEFCSPQVLQFALEWCYTDTFCWNTPTWHEALEIIEFGYAVLCTRLSNHAVNACLIPAINKDNVLEMTFLAKLHNLERLEKKCIEVIAGHDLKTLAHQAEFVDMLQLELADIVQGGDVRVADVPIAADIRRAIRNQSQNDDEEKQEKLQLLQQAVESALTLYRMELINTVI
jgi:hypothetical protein